jgi:hypothetical protein
MGQQPSPAMMVAQREEMTGFATTTAELSKRVATPIIASL